MTKLTRERALWTAFYLLEGENEITERGLSSIVHEDDPTLPKTQIAQLLWDLRGDFGWENIYLSRAQIGEGIVKSILNPFTDEDEISLLDRVIQLISGPYVRNTMTGSVLKKLKAALLNPEEITKFTAQQDKATTSCAQCGKDFALGEAATSYVDIQDRGRVFVCTRCRRFSFVACPSNKCDEAVEVEIDFGALKPCNQHGAKADKQPEPEPEVIQTRTYWEGFINQGLQPDTLAPATNQAAPTPVGRVEIRPWNPPLAGRRRNRP